MTGRLPRHHYVRFDGNLYSIDPSMAGGQVEVIADLDRVSIVRAGRVVAEHVRCHGQRQSITDANHRQAA
jgi:hypothetical protein